MNIRYGIQLTQNNMANVHFDFIVDDIDAENIFDAVSEIRKEAVRRLCGVAMEPICKDCSENEKSWWSGRKSYGDELLLKMKHTSVEE